MIKELNLNGWWEKYAPIGSKIQQVELDQDNGNIVGYGIPEESHNCDSMGCPSTRHILFILEG